MEEMDKHVYQVVFSNGYLLIGETEDGPIVVDTGSQASFHETGRMTFCGMLHEVPRSIMGISQDTFSRVCGVRVKGLLGMDIMSRYDVWFNLMERDNNPCIFVYEQDWTGDDIGTETTFAGVPVLRMNVDGNRCKMIFDTGAPVSYLSQELTRGKSNCGHIRDIAPGFSPEPFETDLFELPYSVDSPWFWHHLPHLVKFGNLPDSIESVLQRYGIDGIIGMDLLKDCRIILHHGKVVMPPQGI